MKSKDAQRVPNVFRFHSVPVLSVRDKIRTDDGAVIDRYTTTEVGLRIARFCASQVALGNVVEYTETRDEYGQIWASGFVRNPMGF